MILHRIATAGDDVTVSVVRWARSGEESYVLRWSGVVGMRQASVVRRGIHKHPMFIGTAPVLCHEAEMCFTTNLVRLLCPRCRHGFVSLCAVIT